MKTGKSYYSITTRNEFLRILMQLILKITFVNVRCVVLYLFADTKLVSYRTTIRYRVLFDIVIYEIKNRSVMRFSGELSDALMDDGLCF